MALDGKEEMAGKEEVGVVGNEGRRVGKGRGEGSRGMRGGGVGREEVGVARE